MGGTEGATKESKRCSGSASSPANNNNKGDDEIDDLYIELWHACAGPHSHVPRLGEKVYYFPQGHVEQVQAYANQDGNMEMPIYNLPSKILCKVVYIQLKAEAHTDEVYAQITLLPLTEQEQSLEDEEVLPFPQKSSAFSFSKALTPSDTSTHGGFSVPKRYADKCFPQLDMSQQPPVQELVAKDLHGFEWHFRHIFRGQPKRHLLTSGWSTFISSKKLITGDACIFLRGENGELRVGVRHAMNRRIPSNTSTSVISGHSMQHGILASAFHAISTGTIFTVYYRPWTSPAHFMIPRDQYLKSAEREYLAGTRFRFGLEGEECIEKRLTGTVVGVEDHDPIRWPNSEWRCLKVKWDASSNMSSLPERLSPWSIKPTDSTHNADAFLRSPPKRGRELDLSSPGFSSLAREGFTLSSVKRIMPQRQKGVLQGQEISNVHVHEPGAKMAPMLPQFIMPPNPNWKSLLQLENHLQFPMQAQVYQCPRGEIAFPGETMVPSSLTNQLCSKFATYSRSFSVSNGNSTNSGSQEFAEQRSNDEAPRQPNGSGKYMLFGVNLFHGHPELPSPQAATSNELLSSFSLPPTSQSSVSEPPVHVSDSSNNKSVFGLLSEKQCKQCCSITNRSCSKVLKHGTALGRSVDLTNFGGYEELISELDEMFEFNGSLIDGSSGWKVTYMDDERDLMLVGDYDWQMFRSAARRMFICPKEEINKMNPGTLKSTISLLDE